MRISPKLIAETLFAIHAEQPNVPVVSISLALKNYLEKKHSMYMLPAILKKFEEKRIALEQSASCIVTLADESHSSEISVSAIEKIFSTSIDAILSKIDPDIIGGFVAEYKYQRYDASIKSSLISLKQHLLANVPSS